jgi:hypothetical protein
MTLPKELDERKIGLEQRERAVESREKELEERKLGLDKREKEVEYRYRGLDEGHVEMQMKIEGVERRERELEERREEFEKEREKWVQECNESPTMTEWKAAMETFKKEMNLEISVERKKAEERESELETRVMKKVIEILAQDKDEQKRKKRWDVSLKPLTR